MPSSRLLIDCAALKRRFEELGRTIMPMVKGNGYGLGIFELASFYDKLGVPFVGVSYIEEALFLRERGYSAPILTLTCSDFALAAEYNITVALNSLEEAQKIERLGKKLACHLQLDLGLSRFGFTKKEAYTALPFIHKSRYIQLEGLMSHFGSRENEAADFEEMAQVIRPRWIHMASSKSLNQLLPSCNMVRLGLTLLRGLTLESFVVSLKNCHPEDRLGYGGILCEKERTLAILNIGYHDGLHAHYSGKGFVQIAGQKAPYVANIYMDFLVVDVTGLNVKVGDRAEIFGPNIPFEEVASWGQTNPRQLLCCLGPRIKREYVNIRESLGTGKAHCAL